MKYLLPLLLLTACASTQTEIIEFYPIEKVERCAEIAVDAYNDLCAESRSCEGVVEDGEEPVPGCSDAEADKRGYGSLLIEMHFEGVKCGADFVARCLESGQAD